MCMYACIKIVLPCMLLCRDACNSFCTHLVSLEDFQELKKEFLAAVKGNCRSSQSLVQRWDEVLAEKSQLQLKFRELQEQLVDDSHHRTGSGADCRALEQLLLGSTNADPNSSGASAVAAMNDRDTSCASPLFPMLNEKACNTTPIVIDAGEYYYQFLLF